MNNYIYNCKPGIANQGSSLHSIFVLASMICNWCFVLLQLFDLLGFDCFELIQSLLEKRQSLVEATFKSATDIVMAHHLSESRH